MDVRQRLSTKRFGELALSSTMSAGRLRDNRLCVTRLSVAAEKEPSSLGPGAVTSTIPPEKGVSPRFPRTTLRVTRLCCDPTSRIPPPPTSGKPGILDLAQLVVRPDVVASDHVVAAAPLLAIVEHEDPEAVLAHHVANDGHVVGVPDQHPEQVVPGAVHRHECIGVRRVTD